MKQVKGFYLDNAVYKVDIDGVEARLKLDYTENTYEVEGSINERIVEIAQLLLSKKHQVNFAYKFNDKIEK